jgi:hypothetical protein
MKYELNTESLVSPTGKGLMQMLDQRMKEQITAEETSRFMDGNFGQLDLSGSPDFTHPPAEETELIGDLADECAERVANEFRRRNPGYLKCDANWRSIVATLAHNLLGKDECVPILAVTANVFPWQPPFAKTREGWGTHFVARASVVQDPWATRMLQRSRKSNIGGCEKG